MTNKIQQIAQLPRTYTKPKSVIGKLTEAAEKYLVDSRKFSPETLDAYRVGCTVKGNIAIPFYDEKNELQLVKFRAADGGMLKLPQNGQPARDVKTYIEPGGKPILLGSNLCHASAGPLVICFGDYDAMAVYQSGVSNCVSLPFGDKGFDFVKEQWDFIEQFAEIVLFPDADEYPNSEAKARAERKLAELVQRLGLHRCRIVQDEHRHGTKDANELLIKHGPAALRTAVENAEWFPEHGLVKIADFEGEPFKIGNPTGFSEIDKNTGGFGRGDLVLIGGDNGAGKTTVALNLIAKSIDLRIPVLFWSGEQRVGRIRYWFERIAAGRGYLKETTARETGFKYFFPHDEFMPFIKNWYRDYFLQYTDFTTTKEKYFEVAELAIRRYGVGVIVIDNLMAFTGGEGESYYQAQGDFVQSCKMFAETWNVVVILIVHNKKPHGNDVHSIRLPSKDDVEGSKKITNWADVILQMYRIPPALQAGEWAQTDGVINLCKCRESGFLGVTPVLVDTDSNRITQLADKGDAPIYGWEAEYHKAFAQTVNI